MQCKICGNKENNRNYRVKEMMFGFRDTFDYFECSYCGCLQISQIPKNMSKYYPSKYYSFQNKLITCENPIKSFFRKHRDISAITCKGLIGTITSIFFPASNLFTHLRNADINLKSNILDVGCGAGILLNILSNVGFENLLGIDPYIEKDIINKKGLMIFKKNIHDLEGNFKLIIFNHSFEHISDPIKTIKKVSELLLENGLCLIRTPTTSSYAWEKYRHNWVQIDAPRHFFIYSIESIKILANQAGLTLKNIIYDSTGLQFWGSEQYVNNIPLCSSISYQNNPDKSIFSSREIAYFERKAKSLNKKNLGDQATFYLTKI